MYCKKCGKEISGKNLYCPFCGEKQEQKEPDTIMTFFKTRKKEIYLLFCWIILNTLVYFIIGNPCEKDFFPDLDYSEDGFGNHTYIVCTFLAPLLYWAFREGIKYLQIHSTMNTNSIKIISLIVGIIPVFFLFTVLAMIIGKIFEMYSESIIQLNFVLAIIGVEFFYRDLFTTKK